MIGCFLLWMNNQWLLPILILWKHLTMCHCKLGYKLWACGVSGNLLKWTESLLIDRSQCTRVGDSVSSFISITSGVIQGSCIGPLFFILYINDIADLFDNRCLCKLYADGLKLYTSVSTAVDLENLQSSLKRLVEWSHTWRLKISYTICSLLYINGVTSLHNVDMLLGSDKIVTVDSVKDLRITVDSELKFSSTLDTLLHAHMLEQTSSTNVSCPEMFILLHVPLLFMSALC